MSARICPKCKQATYIPEGRDSGDAAPELAICINPECEYRGLLNP